MNTKRIAIYNQNCTMAGRRAWDAEKDGEDVENGDVTWYGESDMDWAKEIASREVKNSNDLYLSRVSAEILAAF